MMQRLRVYMEKFRRYMTALRGNNHESQVLLTMQYKQMLHSGMPLPTFDEVGFSVYSGEEEDGILLYIFSLIGTTNRKLVDIGAGDLYHSNAANLIVNHGWVGLLVDGDPAVAGRAMRYWNAERSYPPTVVHAWVTAENVNTLLTEHDFTGEIDLLTMDIDGNDYWVWEALEVASPRVVLIEYQSVIDASRAWVIPYDPDFGRGEFAANAEFPGYSGASLAALVHLAGRKGYRLVGSNLRGYNAFFVRSDVGQDCLPAVSVESCLDDPYVDRIQRDYFPLVKDMDWVDVSGGG